MAIFIFWIIGCVVVGMLGADRSIGFWTSFFVSLLLSPIIGLIVVLFSKTNDDIKREERERINARLNQQNLMDKINTISNQTESHEKDSSIKISTADEIAKFKKLLDDGVILPEEFEAKKKQLLGL